MDKFRCSVKVCRIILRPGGGALVAMDHRGSLLVPQHPWKTRIIASGLKPRQFEFHPHVENVIAAGCIDGSVGIIDTDSNALLALDSSISHASDPILALCWLHNTPERIMVGSGDGVLKVLNTSAARHCNESNLTVSEFQQFEQMTSVHVSCDDKHVIASGYSTVVPIYDLETQQVVRRFSDIHATHINISRFANTNPNLFATSSFDGCLKVWDLRVKALKPNYTIQNDNPIVMFAFSPNDQYILTSGEDNDVRQFITLDGRLQMRFDIPRTDAGDNYSRSYYMNNGDTVLSAGSLQPIVRQYNAYTGDLEQVLNLFPGTKMPCA